MSVWETFAMGRHSAPDDDEDVVQTESAGDVLVAAEPTRGRHAAPDEDGDSAGDAVDTVATLPRRQPNTDLHLLREDPALRARCAAALIVPFLLYTVALLVIGHTDAYLIWLWIPAVSAGVLAGSFIDLAVRRKHREAQPSDIAGD
jgi:hypothetical protein